MNDEQITTWKIDIEGNKLIYKNYYEKPVSCVNMRDYLGSHLLPNDDLIVIATNCIAIYTLIKNEIRIVYYINIDIFMNVQRRLKDELQILAHQEPFKSKNLWGVKYFKHVLDYMDEESEKDVAQSLRNMITLYIDDIYTLSCCSPYIMESIVKYNDRKRKFRKHDNEIINLIIDNCINCYNRDNSKFDVLRAIASLISDLKQLYPSHATKFLISTAILSHADEKINYAPNSHLDGSIDELPESAVSKSFNSIYGHIYDFIEAIIIGVVGSYVVLNLGLFIVILFGNQTNTLELFVMVVTFLAAGLTIFIMLWVSIVDALHDRRSYYPAVKLLIPLPKFASYPTKYNFLFELLKPTPNEFIKTALQTQIPIIYSDWNGEALLNFKWNRFGKFYYYAIWMVYTIFLLAFILATSLPNNYISSENQRVLLIFSIIMGFSQLTIEIRQFIWDWRSYIVSSWNWFGNDIMLNAHILLNLENLLLNISHST
ncbi:25505_t:CDS:1 [Dentiscutata erythropus]|uniref:25505_t:CDS:1 n=1 Tax=Dentiscutata erythropus TaxID=1348616 RepID=A0A9N9GFS2_9GLOM|nr:25505_t:CDS:1 [Dentiscutata erythropus]